MNRALLILTVATLGCGSAAAYFHSQLDAERQRNDELQTRIAHLEASRPPNPFASLPRQASPELTQIDPAAEKPLAAAAPVASVVRESSRPPALSQERPAQVRQRFVNRQRDLLRDPEYREAMRMQQRYSLQHLHPEVARELGISQEQADRLLDLLADHQMRNMESHEAFTAENPPSEEAMAEMQKARQQRQRDHRAEIAALLGDGGLQQWEGYQNSLGARMRVRQLSSELDSAGVPLREDQRQPLRDTLVHMERQAREDTQRALVSQPFERMTPLEQVAWQEENVERTAQSYERARDSVAHILTAEQLAKYRDLHERELTIQRANLRMQRAELQRQAESGTGNTVVTMSNGIVSSFNAMPAAEVAAEQ